MPEVPHAHSHILAWSLNHQSAVGSEVLDANIQYMRPVKEMRAWTINKLSVSDQGHFGKGHEFATSSQALRQSYELASANRFATDLDVLMAARFVMGAVASSQPDAIGSPNTYEHAITFQAVTTNEPAYASFIEYMHDGADPGWEYKYSDACITEFSLSGQNDDNVNLAWQAIALTRADETASVPSAVSTASVFKSQRAALSFGAEGAAATISAKLLTWNLTVRNQAGIKWRAGQASGIASGSRIDIGERQVTFTAQLELDDTERILFENHSECVLTLTLSSDDQVDSADKTIVISIPHLVLTDESFGQEEFTITWNMTMNESGLLLQGGDEPLTITISTDIDDSEIGVQGSS